MAKAATVKEAETPPWFKRWQRQDFSWRGLTKHQAWPSKDKRSLQEYLRDAERNVTDEELVERGVLIPCARSVLYHVLFIPPEWTTGRSAVCSSEELDGRKRDYWSKLQSVAGLGEHWQGTIAGVHLPEDVEQRFASAFSMSFSWVRFRSAIRNIAKLQLRHFDDCAFEKRVLIKGIAAPTPGKAQLRFLRCEFDDPIDLEAVSELSQMEFDESTLRDFITIVSSSLGKIRFDSCSIAGFRMTSSKVDGEVTLYGCNVHRSLEFANCRLADQLLFLDSSFDGSLDLLDCDFVGRVTFADVFWPPLQHLAASASGSRFESIVTIASDAPPPVQLFQDAEFASKVAFRGFSDRERRKAFWQELTSKVCSEPSLVNPRRQAEALESGSRTLRQVASAAGDVHGEQFWHRSEIIARTHRGEAGLPERLFSNVYGVVADYGLSIGRPFFSLVVVILSFAVLYAWLGGQAWFGEIDMKSLEEGFGYSLNRTIPIGVFADEANMWRAHLLGSAGDVQHIAIRAVATMQSIISAVLIYLGVMAIRRKFRIT